MRSVSFEYFPSRSEKAENALTETIEVLCEHQPVFQSVTFGAGGSQKDGTLQTLEKVSNLGKGAAACHLTYSGMTRADIHEFANTLWEKGYRRLVALRGDAEEKGVPAFENTAAFVWSLMREHPFEIAVSCYPEVHPKAHGLEEDLAVLKAKQDAGASLSISQFFFNNNVFYNFVKAARDYGITIPIVPGILPIYDFERVKKMASECGTVIPQYYHDAFEGARTAGSSELEIASELLKEQVRDLAYEGYEQLHIYTLNRTPLASLAAETFLNTDNVVEFKKAG